MTIYIFKLYTAAPDGSVFHDIYDGQKFKFVLGKGRTTTSETLYLPLAIDQALYTADTVLLVVGMPVAQVLLLLLYEEFKFE
jgi:hypothetical protein